MWGQSISTGVRGGVVARCGARGGCSGRVRWVRAVSISHERGASMLRKTKECDLMGGKVGGGEKLIVNEKNVQRREWAQANTL